MTQRSVNALKESIREREFDLAKNLFGLTDGKNNKEHNQGCPICGGKDRFWFNPKSRTFHCRQCGFGGDIIALYRHVHGVDFGTAFDRIAESAGYIDGTLPVNKAQSKKRTAAKGKKFRAGTVRKTNYVYTDEEGNPRHRIQRLDGINDSTGEPDKTCSQWNMDSGTWQKGKPNITFPYHLPEVLAVAKEGGTVFIPEGEKACDSLIEVLRAAKVKAIATTNPGGTPMGNHWYEYVKRYPDIANAKVIILPDNDNVGREHSRKVASAILAVNPDADVKIVELYSSPSPEGGYDFVDWYADIQKDGKDESAVIETLNALCERAEPITPDVVTQWTAKPAAAEQRLKITLCANIEIKPPNWLLRNMIPNGELTIISGAGGVGKTFWTCYLASLVTNGYEWGGIPIEIGSVLFFAGEGRKDRFAERLQNNEVNLNLCGILEGKEIYCHDSKQWILDSIIFQDRYFIEKAIDNMAERTGKPVRLLVADPIGNFFGDVKTSKDTEVRRILIPLQQIAEKNDIAFILVAHHGKAFHANSQNQVLESVGLVNAARSVWQIYRDKEDKNLRYFAPSKTNDCIDPKAVSYRIVAPEGQVQIVDTDIDKHADDFMVEQRQDPQRGRPPETLSEAETWLQEYLADGGKLATEIYEAGKARKFSKSTIDRAKKSLGIESNKERFSGRWVWKLPFPEGGQNSIPSPEEGQNAIPSKP